MGKGSATVRGILMGLVLGTGSLIGADVVIAQEPGGIEPADGAAWKPVLAMLPRKPVLVMVADAEAASPEVRATLRRLDAFVMKGRTGIYVVKQSAVLQGALQGSAVHQRILASILWHEMAHLAGADEREAQRREEELWTRFVRDQQVDAVTALRYLQLLKQRH